MTAPKEAGIIRPEQEKAEHLFTKKIERFCIYYIESLNGTEAAIKAGFPEKNANSTARRLLNRLDVQEFIQVEFKRLRKKVKLKVNDVVDGLWKEARGDGPDTNSKSRVAAWTALGKHLGIFQPERSEIKIEITELGSAIEKEWAGRG